MTSDHLLKASITEELEWSPEVTADHIGVGVHDGTVTLSGQVNAYPEKVAAVAATLRVRGVTGVADEIEVQHDRGHLADSEIAGAAARILTSNVVLPLGRVTATVRHHRVTLEGTVQWQYQRDNAVRLVAGLHGVAEVVNRIQLAPDSQPVRAGSGATHPRGPDTQCPDGRGDDPRAHLGLRDRANRNRSVLGRVRPGRRPDRVRRIGDLQDEVGERLHVRWRELRVAAEQADERRVELLEGGVLVERPPSGWPFGASLPPVRSPRQCIGPSFAMPRRLCVVIGPFIGWKSGSVTDVQPDERVRGCRSLAVGSPRSHARLSKSPKMWQLAHAESPWPSVARAS